MERLSGGGSRQPLSFTSEWSTDGGLHRSQTKLVRWQDRITASCRRSGQYAVQRYLDTRPLGALMSCMSNRPEKLAVDRPQGLKPNHSGPGFASGSLSQAKWLVILLSWIAMGLPSRASDLDGATKAPTAETHTTWRAYGGAADGAQYSALRQINRSNVN